MEVINKTASKGLNCSFGVLSRPDGSVLLSEGKTTVIAAVYGPVEVKSQRVLIDKASVEAHFRPKSGLPGISDRLNESVIRNVCESVLTVALYPRSGIIVIIQELQNNGGLIACAVNAACLALLDSGIEMQFLVAAVSCVLHNNGSLHLAPDYIELEDIKASFVFVFDSVNGHIVASNTTGSFAVDSYEKAVNVCRSASAQVFDYYKSSISERFK